MKSEQFHIPPTWMFSENARRRAASRKKGVRLIAGALFFAQFVREIRLASAARLEIIPCDPKKIDMQGGP